MNTIYKLIDIIAIVMLSFYGLGMFITNFIENYKSKDKECYGYFIFIICLILVIMCFKKLGGK